MRPLILERFLEPKSTQDREKVVSKSLQKITRFVVSFFIDFCSILDPTGHSKIHIFHKILLLVSLLDHLGAESAPKVLQDGSRVRFSNLGSISEGILKIFNLLSSANAYLISYRVFYFREYYNKAVAIYSSNSQFLARWRFDARSALDRRYHKHLNVCYILGLYRVDPLNGSGRWPQKIPALAIDTDCCSMTS